MANCVSWLGLVRLRETLWGFVRRNVASGGWPGYFAAAAGRRLGWWLVSWAIEKDLKERLMVRSRVWIFAVAVAMVAAAPAVVRGQAKDDKADDKTVVKTEIDKGDGSKLADFKPEQQASKGSVTIG